MLYAAAQEVDIDQQLGDASKVVFHDTIGWDRETLFFLCADGKAQMSTANCKNSRAEDPQAMVCGNMGAIGHNVLPTWGRKTPSTGGGMWCSQLERYMDTLHPTAAFRTTYCAGCGVSLYVVSRACAM